MFVSRSPLAVVVSVGVNAVNPRELYILDFSASRDNEVEPMSAPPAASTSGERPGRVPSDLSGWLLPDTREVRPLGTGPTHFARRTSHALLVAVSVHASRLAQA